MAEKYLKVCINRVMCMCEQTGISLGKYLPHGEIFMGDVSKKKMAKIRVQNVYTEIFLSLLRLNPFG